MTPWGGPPLEPLAEYDDKSDDEVEESTVAKSSISVKTSGELSSVEAQDQFLSDVGSGTHCGTRTSSAISEDTISCKNSVFDEEPLPLLEAWSPCPLPQGHGQFSIRIRRASTRQPFGIGFDASGVDTQRRPSISVRDDMPHLGILKGDVVVSVNGHKPNTVSECRVVLGEALALCLVMKRSLPGVPKEETAVGSSSSSSRAPTQLLSIQRAVVTDGRRGEFRLTITRASRSQKFGLVFRESVSTRNVNQLAVVIAQNLPHLALRKGDKLVEINGVRLPNRDETEMIVEEEMSLTLLFRRSMREGLHKAHLVHFLQPLPECDEPESEESPGRALAGSDGKGRRRRANLVDPSGAEIEVLEERGKGDGEPEIEDCVVKTCISLGCAEPQVVERGLPEAEEVAYDTLGKGDGAFDYLRIHSCYLGSGVSKSKNFFSYSGFR